MFTLQEGGVKQQNALLYGFICFTETKTAETEANVTFT